MNVKNPRTAGVFYFLSSRAASIMARPIEVPDSGLGGIQDDKPLYLA